MPDTFRSQYAALVAAGKIEPDPAQAVLVARLDALAHRIEQRRLSRKSSSLGWLFSKREQGGPSLKGLYVHGDVGRGKTMLMDLFFASSPVTRKRRVHFHEFMTDVHERVRGFRHKIKRGEIRTTDPIKLAADQIAEETWLLCFDEFHVTDIADAMILGRLFTRLFEHGVVLVATSNVAPDDLYAEGLNRALFVPFIHLLQQRVNVVRLEARTDYRLEKLERRPGLVCAGRRGRRGRARPRLAKAHRPARRRAARHSLAGPRAARAGSGHGRGAFCLCPALRTAARPHDYLRLAREFHTLIVDNIPVMDFPQRNAAKRFIILIDTLYDNAVKLVASAAAEPAELYRARDGYEAHEFKRTASRLIEMRSQSYLALPHGARSGADTGDTGGIVET